MHNEPIASGSPRGPAASWVHLCLGCAQDGIVHARAGLRTPSRVLSPLLREVAVPTGRGAGHSVHLSC